MRVSSLLNMAKLNFQSVCAERLYKFTGYDVTIPTMIVGYLTNRCNIKCRYCNYWRLDRYGPEMSIKEWQRALLSIKSLTGTFLIGFMGGEPFIKPGIFDLLAWCRDNGIQWCITTNGTALTKENARKIVHEQPFYFNISIDSSNSNINDYIRGHEGLLEKLAYGLNYLKKERENQGSTFPIIVKSTITSLNFRHLPELAAWAIGNGASAINFSPMHRIIPETLTELWIGKNDLDELAKVVGRLIEMKAEGKPIVNSRDMLLGIPLYFREQGNRTKYQRCRHVFYRFKIQPNGDVFSCDSVPSIGNIREQTATGIWYGKTARQIRKAGIYCKDIFYTTPITSQGILQKIRIARSLMRSKRSNVSDLSSDQSR